jgi:arylsulfatase A-like enzyme
VITAWPRPRRLVLVRFLLCLLVFSAVSGCWNDSVPCADCNVVLISMDTLRADHVGAYGYGRPTTPNIDAFAAQSVVFERAVSQSAWTRPAHASMFTGLYPSEHGIVGISGEPAIPRELPLLAEVLANGGYRTVGLVGGGNVDARFGFGRGFERYEQDGRRFEDHMDAALMVLRDPDRRPFFLFLHGFDAHKPYKSRPEDRRSLGLAGERARGMERICAEGARPDRLAPHVDEYDAAIHRGDRSLGRLFEQLGAVGNGRPTVVIFTSDHGEEFGEHGGCWHIRSLHREIVEVPLVVLIPGFSPLRVDGPIPASVSIAPTILDVVGVRGRPLPGPSLLPQLMGHSSPGLPVISQTESRLLDRSGGELWALTSHDEKLLEWSTLGRRELYNLTTDPGEHESEHEGPDVERAGRQVAHWRALHGPVAPPRHLGRLPIDLKRQLKRLGYAE